MFLAVVVVSKWNQLVTRAALRFVAALNCVRLPIQLLVSPLESTGAARADLEFEDLAHDEVCRR